MTVKGPLPDSVTAGCWNTITDEGKGKAEHGEHTEAESASPRLPCSTSRTGLCVCVGAAAASRSGEPLDTHLDTHLYSAVGSEQQEKT